MKTLTRSQKLVYDYVCETLKQTGIAPTFREIQNYFSFSSLGTVYNFVKILKRKGFFVDDKHASIALAKPQDILKTEQECQIPFIGLVAQGFPIETFPRTKNIKVPSSLVPAPDNTYVLKAKGETLSEERIADGDLLVVEARQEAQYGEIVLATINNYDTIVKRYYPEGSYVRLEGSHDQHQPIILEKDEVVIQGILIGLIRIY
ncbi:LexA repressor [Chlamydiales bacterium STE3]|nr:LexA repressor [Chlamydiales bacterium STE3]